MTDDKDKEEARAAAAARLAVTSLSADERERFLCFEFDRGPVGLAEQIDRYYLMVKRDVPVRAPHLYADMSTAGVDLQRGSDSDVQLAAKVISDYVSGFVLYTQDRRVITKRSDELKPLPPNPPGAPKKLQR